MKNKINASVIIPTIDRGPFLIDTVLQLKEQSYKKFEIIVVDQSIGHDDVVQIKIDKLSKNTMRYYKVVPRSVTAAKNFGIKKAKGEILIFLDDDIKIKKDFIKNHLDAYKKHPDAAAVAGRVLQEGFPVINKNLKFNDYGQSEGTFTGTKEGETNTFPGGNCSVKKRVAIKVGGFDTRYYGGSFREESDFANKIHKAGYKIYYYPKAEIFHLAAPSGGNRVNTHIYDNPSFYANEIFFTIRFVDKSKILKALIYKYSQYCRSVDGSKRLRRSRLFAAGIIRAIFRNIINKQTVASELK